MNNIPLIGVPKWQIRILSHEPAEINYTEQMQYQNLRPVLERARTLIGRTSYMVNAPNREVMWSIERWVNDGKKKPRWVTVMQGRSRLRPNARPQLCACCVYGSDCGQIILAPNANNALTVNWND